MFPKLIPGHLKGQVHAFPGMEARGFPQIQAHVRVVMPGEGSTELLTLLEGVLRVGWGFLLVVDDQETSSGEGLPELGVDVTDGRALRIFQDMDLPEGIDDYQMGFRALQVLPEILGKLSAPVATDQDRVTREVEVYLWWQGCLTLKAACDEGEGGVYLDVEDWAFPFGGMAEERLSSGD